MGYGWIELRSSLSPADVSNSDGRCIYGEVGEVVKSWLKKEERRKNRNREIERWRGRIIYSFEEIIIEDS